MRSRRVVLIERARGVICDYRASLGRVPTADEFPFRSRTGANRPITRIQAHRILKRLYQEFGIDATRVSKHSLRKTFVRAVYDASGHGLVRTQRIVLHDSPLTTARHLESTQSELDEIFLGLGADAGRRRPTLPSARFMSTTQAVARAPSARRERYTYIGPFGLRFPAGLQAQYAKGSRKRFTAAMRNAADTRANNTCSGVTTPEKSASQL